MSDWKEERQDYILGGIAIILLGILLSGSAVWGLVVNVYSMNGGLAPPLFLILGTEQSSWAYSYPSINPRGKKEPSRVKKQAPQWGACAHE